MIRALLCQEFEGDVVFFLISLVISVLLQNTCLFFIKSSLRISLKSKFEQPLKKSDA